MDKLPQIVIAGSGAMACLFAARLAAAGIQPTMLGSWQASLDALANQGVIIHEADGRVMCYPVLATNDVQSIAEHQYALVLVKSWQTQRTAQQLASCLGPDGIALTLQNGLGNRETLASVLGSQRAGLGITTLGATLLAPGNVRAAGDGVITLEANARLRSLAALLRQSGFVVENAPNPSALVWGKLVINAAINPLTALLKVPNGELLNRPSARKLLAATAREVAAVAVARGIQLPYPDPVLAVETIARRTAKNISSMLQDVNRGAPTEIDAICGAVVKAGKRTGVATPINQTLLQLVKALTLHL